MKIFQTGREQTTADNDVLSGFLSQINKYLLFIVCTLYINMYNTYMYAINI